MPNSKPDPELRRRAEEEVQERGRVGNLSEQDVRILCHELEVHQVELELQNEALQEMQGDLQASEEKYRDLYDFAPIGYATLNADGRILEANLAAASLLGTPRAQITNQRFQLFLEPESISDFTAFCARVIGNGGSEAVEVRLMANRKREPAWVLIEGQAIPEQGQTFRAALIEITDRKQAEEALIVNEERYRRFFEDDLTGDFIATPDGGIVLCNPAFLRIFGFSSQEEAIASRIAELFLHPEGYAEFVDLIRKHRVLHEHEGDRLRRDGATIHVVENVMGTFDERGELVLFKGYVFDDTERKQAEEALLLALAEAEESRRILEAIMDFVPDGIAITGGPPDFPVMKISRYCREMIEGSKTGLMELVTGQRRGAWGLFLPDGATRPEPGQMPLYRAGHYGEEIKNQEFILRTHDDRAIPVIVNAAPVRDGEGRVVGAINAWRDVSSLKRAEEERALLHIKLEQAHLEANLYLDIMTHDIRNANNVSGMYADLMLDLLEGEPKVYAQRLNDCIRRSTEILRNVATIRRVCQESADLSPVDLDTVIREEIKNFPTAQVRYNGLPVKVLADSLLPMIFVNLLGNAAKFGGPDAEITVRVEDQDGEVLVSVEDTGPGIPDEVKGMLFQRFERGLGQGRGEGLGLYIVRTLVERYGGRIWIEDRIPGSPEQGALFRFTLREGGVHR